jgi:hypothetical protein
MRKFLLSFLVISVFGAGSVMANSLSLSIGIRETQQAGGLSGGPIFSNGGTFGSIEFVNLDGQTLVADGTWQLFTFTPSLDTITAFAGATANSILEGEWGTLEMIRIRNSGGITAPIRLWIDNVSNTTSTGTVTEGFESAVLGTEVMFQEPSFSGSTSGNLLPGSSSLVSSSAAFAGDQANEINFQFVDDAQMRWIRLTTFGTPNLPNPAVRLAEQDFNPTISFYAKAMVVPVPAALPLLGSALGALLLLRRRQRQRAA